MTKFLFDLGLRCVIKITFVHPFPIKISDLEQDQEGLRRERLILEVLQEIGFEVSAFGFADDLDLPLAASGSVVWTYLPYSEDNKNHSTKFLLEQVEPGSCVILKGVGTILGEMLFQIRACRVLILGGRHYGSETFKSDLILTENAYQEGVLKRFGFRKRLLRLPKLISDEFFRPRMDEEVFDFVVISSFKPWKNHVLLKALASEPVRIAFIGDGPKRDEIESYFADSIAQAVFFGTISNSEVATILLGSKLLLHPSLLDGTPRGVVEALAAGCPVVGLRETLSHTVEHGVDGVLTSSSSFCSVAMNLLDDHEKISRMSNSARLAAISLSLDRDQINQICSSIQNISERQSQHLFNFMRFAGRRWFGFYRFFAVQFGKLKLLRKKFPPQSKSGS